MEFRGGGGLNTPTPPLGTPLARGEALLRIAFLVSYLFLTIVLHTSIVTHLKSICKSNLFMGSEMRTLPVALFAAVPI